mmetsp:Transcript_59765/g.142204  ORF Transcript_59765/g.142204 Transcript_59765/m.142204 type:complete len:513 (-) Transcript_59765:165-1703(-)|eukprot:CAMPEP_0178424916 /NCGR_PEP_ID=MMETSP0689_2-20121128/28456_1 /TAXON_ID=160604 /ORGANISM="Amphidinium massartii, Strain CS-259" /LENGTH=512 /DNA_ID=CAMNT_0020046567 /DNA_START=27 /DNA_END=1565 /DNA_ORIENTATION=+
MGSCFGLLQLKLLLLLALLPWTAFALLGHRHQGSLIKEAASAGRRHIKEDEKKTNRPKSATWFGSFSESESTYNDDMDGTHPDNPFAHNVDGWDPSVVPLYGPPDAVPSEWFHESASAGSLEAWQTHYPSLQTGIGGHGSVVGPWRQNAGGSWVQDYVPAANSEEAQQGAMPADWFDTNVNNYDGFGRQNSPSLTSARRFSQWQERAVNTTLSCQSPGCNSSVTIQAFDGVSERARHCKFSFYVHPTDFDDVWSPEPIRYITINGVQVRSDCKIKRDGCNATAWRPLHPCVRDLDISQLMFQTGTITVSAAINEYVDECPYEGNMLAAVPMVTCLVEPQQLPPLLGTAPGGVNYPTVPATVYHVEETWQTYSAPLKCQDRGCTAETILDVNETWVLQDRVTCLLDVLVNQTDYDGEQGSVEEIVFVAVQGTMVRQHIRPGRNPCLAEWGDNTTALTRSQIEVLALSNYNVTTIAREGNFQVAGAISDLVEECPSQGNMFDALAVVNCSQAPA